MNNPQRFYNQYSLTWKATLFLAVSSAIFILYSFIISDYSFSTITLYFLLPFSLFCFVITFVGYKSWRARNLTITEEGIFVNQIIQEDILIPWINIQSIEYIINTNLFIKLTTHSPMSKKIEIAKIVYHNDSGTLHEKKIVLSSFRPYSGRLVFDWMQKHHQSKHITMEAFQPKPNEVINYNNLSNSSILYPALTSLVVIILFSIFLVNSGIKILALLIGASTLLPYSIYNYLINYRKIALIINQQGIQDGWLHKNNAFIPWTNIRSIEVITLPPSFFLGVLSSRYIAIELINDQLYINSCSQWLRLIIRLGKQKSDPYFLIKENIEKYSLDEIHTMLISEWQKHTKH